MITYERVTINVVMLSVGVHDEMTQMMDLKCIICGFIIRFITYMYILMTFPVSCVMIEMAV